MEKTTLAEVFLGFGGNTLFTLGTLFTSTSVIYGIHKITGLGIRGTEALPYWLGLKEEEDDGLGITREDLKKEALSYIKISSIIVFGVFIKYIGKEISSENFIEGFNKVLYTTD